MMKGRPAFFLLQLLLGFGAAAGTQAQARTSPDEATVRALDDQERAAVLNQDLSSLERLWSDDFVVNAPSNHVTVGKRAALDLVRRGLIHYSSFERRVEFIRVDGDLAIIRVRRPSGRLARRPWPDRRCSGGSRIFGGRKRGCGT